MAAKKAKKGAGSAKPAKATKSAKSAKTAKTAAAASRTRPRVASIRLGVVTFLGARYKVVADDPGLKTRLIRKAPSDKEPIRAPNGKKIVWTSQMGQFRIVFTGAAPDLARPELREFRATRGATAKTWSTAKVVINGHDLGANLSYDIYMPADAPKPLDPSIIIDPNQNLRLVKD